LEPGETELRLKSESCHLTGLPPAARPEPGCSRSGFCRFLTL